MTKLAVQTPPFCASCLQAGPEKRYVDFDAAYDGPVMTLPDGRKQPIDDLVICEGCLQEAFDLLDPQGIKSRIAELEGQLERAEEEIAKKDGMIQRLGVSVTELVDHPIERQPGYSMPAGGTEEMRQYLAARKKDRANKKRSETMKKRNLERAES